MTLSPEQRARLLRTKLAALVRDLGGPEGEPTDLGASAAVVAQGRAAVLIEQGSAAGLSGALLWAARQGAVELTVFVDDAAAADVARWAGYFELGGAPDRRSTGPGRGVAPGRSGAAADRRCPSPQVPTDLIEQLRARRCRRRRRARGRAGRGPRPRGRPPGRVARRGRRRRRSCTSRRASVASTEMQWQPHGPTRRRVIRSPARSSRCARTAIRARRCIRSSCCPANGGCDRWSWPNPRLVGAGTLVAADMTTEPHGLRDVHPAAAVGTDLEGRPVVVVCSTGVDLALVPLAADTRELHDPDARLVAGAARVVTTTARRVTLLGLLRRPADLVDLAPGGADVLPEALSARLERARARVRGLRGPPGRPRRGRRPASLRRALASLQRAAADRGAHRGAARARRGRGRGAGAGRGRPTATNASRCGARSPSSRPGQRSSRTS